MRPSPLSVAFILLALLGFAVEEGQAGDEEARGARLYGAHCASCHGTDRFGGSGPALLPESLERLGTEALIEVIRNGRAATQMRGFAGELEWEDIVALAGFLASEPAEPPLWELADMRESHVILDAGPRPEQPTFEADPLNLFIVVEAGDHHITILDGDRFEPLARLPTHVALHGGPKFSPDGRFVYVASRDGWITKFDLYGLKAVAEVRAGLNTRNLALSGDGKIVAVANDLPRTLVFLDAADLTPIGVVPVQGLKDKTPSRLAGIYQARPRESFIAALKDVPEVWEIPYGKDAEPVFSGLVHSYEAGMVEGVPEATGPFAVRRIDSGTPIDDFFFSPDYRLLIGSSRASGSLKVIHLDTRQVIAEVPVTGLPHLGSGITWMRQGRRVLATPDLAEP
ncbi:MAG TPA: cytochrome D1 domain-containing protein, partial [Alphaproteobacteria bacterium]|nr:cytochrome D1 domain-containing protein [Alphaproteobacteria bacterium]